jgi:putative hydrolase of the HAD superfamily
VIKAIVFDCFGVLAEDGWLPFKRRYIGSNQKLADEIADLGKQNEYGIIGNNQYFERAAELIGIEEGQLRAAVGARVPNEELFLYIKQNLKDSYKIGLMSNASYDVLHELFLPEQADVFDASVLSFESRLVKPDPRMFELMAGRLGVEEDQCIFVDDVERYCAAAEQVGMISIHYKNPDQFRQEILQRLAQ